LAGTDHLDFVAKIAQGADEFVNMDALAISGEGAMMVQDFHAVTPGRGETCGEWSKRTWGGSPAAPQAGRLTALCGKAVTQDKNLRKGFINGINCYCEIG